MMNDDDVLRPLLETYDGQGYSPDGRYLLR